MTNEEFISLLIANSDKTANIRTYPKSFHVGAYRAPEEITKKMGSIITILQTKINEGLICNKNSECILIYNYEPSCVITDTTYCALSFLIKPLSKIHETDDLLGHPTSVSINCKTGAVVNGIHALLETRTITPEEYVEGLLTGKDMEKPIIYGYCQGYSPQCCFLAVTSYKPMDEKDMFSGKYDNSESFQKGVVFESLSEAFLHLNKQKEIGKYILEIPYPSKDINKIKNSMGKEIVKVIDYNIRKIGVNSNPQVQKKVAQLDVEATQLMKALESHTAAATATATNSIK